MPTNGPPPLKWIIEPTQLYIVSYYETNEVTASPKTVNLTMVSYNEAVKISQQFITDNGNLGVCSIQAVTVSMVYPPIVWEDF